MIVTVIKSFLNTLFIHMLFSFNNSNTESYSHPIQKGWVLWCIRTCPKQSLQVLEGLVYACRLRGESGHFPGLSVNCLFNLILLLLHVFKMFRRYTAPHMIVIIMFQKCFDMLLPLNLCLFLFHVPFFPLPVYKSSVRPHHWPPHSHATDHHQLCHVPWRAQLFWRELQSNVILHIYESNFF